VDVVQDQEHPAAVLHLAEHLNQATPDAQGFNVSGSFGPESGQPFRWRLARLRDELVDHAVGKTCLQFRPAYPQHPVMPGSGEERVEQRGLPNSCRPLEQDRPWHAREGLLQAVTQEREFNPASNEDLVHGHQPCPRHEDPMAQ
jgi:hypothetical protein